MIYLIRILRWGRNEGLKIAEIPLHFNQGTTTTHTTLQVRQSLFDSTVAQISTGKEIPIQSLLKIIFRNDVSGYYTHFEPGYPVHIRKSCCSTGRDTLDRLLFFNLCFCRNCYVTTVEMFNCTVAKQLIYS